LKQLGRPFIWKKSVTKRINDIIKTCEVAYDGNTSDCPSPDYSADLNMLPCEITKNDYHTVDYFTGEFLTEQHGSLRQLVGFHATLNKMPKSPLAEMLFDKTIGE